MPPNVLLILSDQHNAGWLGCAGHPQAITPNIDALAAQGVRFANAYCQNPICTPSRVCILSGQYPHSHGYYGLSGPQPRNLPSLFHHFKAHGYRTAGIGKLHLPDEPINWVADVCDELCDIHRGKGAGQTPEYVDYLREHGLLDTEDSRCLKDTHRRGVRIEGDHDSRPSEMPFEHCVEQFMVNRATSFIDQAPGRPFFMELSFPRPHHAITPDKRFWDMYPDDLVLPDSLEADCSHRPPNFREKVAYLRDQHQWAYEPATFHEGSRRVWRGTLASVTQNDHFIGVILDHLRQAGLYNNTIVIYASDHGAYHGLCGIMEKAPGICSDHVCKVPMIWRVPGTTPDATQHQALVELVDIASTLPQLCGLPALDSSEGRDIAALLAGGDQPVRDAAVTELPRSKSIRFDHWRFVHYHRAAFPGQDVGELYDVEADPGETRNLYHDPDHQSIVHEARRRLLEWLTETTRPVTAWPPAPGDKAQGRPAYLLAADGREPANLIADRLSRGVMNTFDVRSYV